MTNNLIPSLQDLMSEGCSAGLFHGAEALVARGSDVLAHVVTGTFDGNTPLLPNSVYDLASLTKPVATATILLTLVEQGLLDLDAEVHRHLPTFGHRGVTLRHLAAHTSGLPATAELALISSNRQTARAALFATAPEYLPGTQMNYSCPGYLVLSEALEAATGKPFQDLFQDLVATPFGMTDTGFNPLDHGVELSRILPTGMCPYRHTAMHGVVHDSNAALFGGVAGNAGLFGTAQDLHKYAVALLERRPSFQDMFTVQTPPDQISRTIGWEIKTPDTPAPSCGSGFPNNSIGHAGFTGTFFWIDPDSETIAILLTNRTGISFRKTIPAMREFRYEFGKIVWR